MATQKIPGRAIKLGTDNAPDTTGDVAYFDGSAWRRLAIGTAGQQLTMNAAGTIPYWGSYCFGGSQFGYTAGGFMDGDHDPYQDVIDKFSFTTDGNAVDVGNLTLPRAYSAGFHSTTHGYTVSGQRRSPSRGTTEIDKYSYATDANATIVGDLVSPITDETSLGGARMCQGFVNEANTIGYAAGFETEKDAIQKISTASDGNATASSATLHTRTYHSSNACSDSHGYHAGGFLATTPGGNVGTALGSTVIQKFAFATDSDGTDVGDLLAQKLQSDAGGSSCSHGYSVGAGGAGIVEQDVIEKWSFATDANATDVGNMTSPRGYLAGQSSKTHGYVSGGGYFHPYGGTPTVNTIDKYSFSTDGNSTDIGDLSLSSRGGCAGTEY
jgi:hypothetical protein